MAWGSYYLFASAAEAQRGMDLLLAEDAARYSVVYLDRTRIDSGERDTEGLPIMIDGPGHLLSVLDKIAPDPVPGWEPAQVSSELAGHTWANGLYQQRAMDEEAPATPVAITTATRPSQKELLVLRERRIARREANETVHRLRAELDEVRDRVDAINERIQTTLPERRDRVIARIDVLIARLGTLRADRDAQVAIAQDTGRSREDREAAREAVETIRATIEGVQAQLDADRTFRAGYADLLVEVRARRDELVARRTALFDLLTQARIERNAAIAALEGA